MKRSWIGFVLLVILALTSILSTMAMTKIHEPLEKDLNQAAECILLGDWYNGMVFFQKAKKGWKEKEHLRACLADHTPVEEVDAAFELLETYAQMGENAAFAAGCRELARKTAAVGEAHEFVWWNIL